MAREALELSWPQVHAFRLRRHHLDRPATRARLAEVARDACGIQAQVHSAARLSLRARVRKLSKEDVERALWESRTLVRTWSVRGTVHLLAAGDFSRFATALRPVAERDTAWIARYIAPEDPDAMLDAVFEALASGPLTRRELTDRVVGRFGPGLKGLVGSGWGGLAKVVSLQGRVCHGPRKGTEGTLVRANMWLRGLKDIDPEHAEDEFLRRYLTAFGPATISDYSAWSGIPVRRAKAAWTRLSEQMVAVNIEGTKASARSQDRNGLQRPPPNGPVVRLLPHFDTYLLGHKDKSHLIDRARYKRVYRKAGWLTPAVLVDGRIAGVWDHRTRKGTDTLTVELFGRSAKGVREGIEAEVEDIGRFKGEPPRLAYGKIP